MTHFIHRQVAYDVIDRISWALALFCFLLAFVLVTVNATKQHHEEGGGASSGSGTYTSRAFLTPRVKNPEAVKKSGHNSPCVQEAEWLDGLGVQCVRSPDPEKPDRPTKRPHVARRTYAVALARWNGDRLSVEEGRLADRMLPR